MKKNITTTLILTSCLTIGFNAMANSSNLTVTSTSIENGKAIAEKFAYCAPDGKGKTNNAGNISPQLTWKNAPKETKSLAIVAVDPDVPAKFDDANKDGKIIAEDFPRQNFYHWVLLNIPAKITDIHEGRGKDPSFATPLINDYAGGKNTLQFAGYDGPCPPWNDARLHHYHFTVYALDVEKLAPAKDSIGKDAIAEIEKHAIAKGELVGTYSNFVKK